MKVGYKAKYFVEKLLKSTKRIDLKNIKRGKYFRIVADVYIDGKSLSDAIIKSGYACKYDGGTKQKINWCRNFKRP